MKIRIKKLVGGKLYDTDTAKFIGEHSKHTPNEPWYRYEALYQKKNGEFFAVGTDITCFDPTRREGRDYGILPIDILMAKDWVWNNLGADAYVSMFGEPEE